MSLRRLSLLLAIIVAVGLGGYSRARSLKRATGLRESKFFKVDLDAMKIVAVSDRVAAALRLDLTSVTTDQPQYWPNEKVHLRLLALGRPGAEWSAKLAKRDSQARDLKGKLDEQGVAVLAVLDGEQAPLELGEYRLDVDIAGGKSKSSATFSVVEGTLGALSFAHEFKKVTKSDELEQQPGGWFLGNATPGARWGNGLSFKNELRVANRPYNGEVEVHSRCMLPGCNGVHAGPSQQLPVRNGVIAGTLGVGGHSGPFQLEVVSPRGSLRHQFEGSSHVEREMIAISGGVSYSHRVGLAPYEQTVQVPGRDLFVESKKAGDDPFAIESVQPQAGQLKLQIKKALKAPQLYAHQPKPDGSFESRQLPLPAELPAGKELQVDLRPPYTLITVAGFVAGEFKEGWAVGLMPAGLKVELQAAASGRPYGSVPIHVSARDLSGKGVALSAILEVYDNRVPARSPHNPLGSALGDSLRNGSRAVSSWVDATGLDLSEDKDEDAAPMHPREHAKKEAMPPSPPKAMPSSRAADSASGLGSLGTIGRGSGGGGYGRSYGGIAAAPMRSMSVARQGVAVPGRSAAASDDEVVEEIREGDRKVIYCEKVTTDAQGQADITVTLPPQTGRMVMRLTAVRALDFAETRRELDVKRDAAVELRLPRSFVAGAKLSIPIDASNQTTETLTLVADGIGLAAPFSRPLPPGHAVFELPLELYKPGTLSVSLRDGNGQLRDRRDVALQTLGSQPVTYSRLLFGSGSKLSVAAGETARVYAGAGPLLRGIVMNVVTTTDSWFGHAEALSARAAVRSLLLAAHSKQLLSDDGMAQTLRASVDKDLRDLDQAFFDKESGLIRPYPGLPASPLWSAWVARNLLSTVHALETAGSPDPRLKQALVTARSLADRLRQELAKRGSKTDEQAGFDSQGQWVLPVELNGQVVYKVETDDAVTRFASEKLLPRLPPDSDGDSGDIELSVSKLADSLRFLRAFERVGSLQYLTDLATAYYLKGDYANFGRLYRQVARGMILSQEPGLLQGPALLGGVYSSPMALVRFLELQLLIGTSSLAKPSGSAELDGQPLRFEQTVSGPKILTVPVGAIVRLDRKEQLQLTAPRPAGSPPLGRASLSKASAQVGEELTLEVNLDPSRDPLEYYAIIAVPTTSSVKQTEDILSDYRGQLLYGQQGQGGTQMQILTVPFRGSRSLRLLLEGAYRGSSPGVVLIRHIERRGQLDSIPISELTIR